MIRSWLADGLEEPLQATAGRLTVGGGRADHERARRVGQHSERVSCAAGHESERTRTSEDELTFDLELDLSVDDVERLFLVGLDVHRWVARRGEDVLHQAVGPAGVGVRCLDRHQSVQGPRRRTVIAVAHRQFLELGPERLRALGSPDGHVLYDLKYVLDKADSDLRL